MREAPSRVRDGAAPNSAWSERVVAGVHVADDREVVAALRRGRVACGDLQVDGLVDGRRPRGRGSPRTRRRRGAERRRIGVGEQLPKRRWSSATSASSAGGRLISGPSPARTRRRTARARRRAAPRRSRLGRSPALRPQYQRPASKTRRSAGATSATSPGPERDVEVAQAVDVGERTGAVGAPGLRVGVAPGQLDEVASSAASAAPSSVAVGAGDASRAARGGRARSRPRSRSAVSGCASSGVARGRPQRAVRAGPRASGSSARRAPAHPRPRDARALADERRRTAHASAGAGVGDPSPRERAEEADRVVLRAVALPVARNDVSSRRRALLRLDGAAATFSTAFASAAGFCQVTASRNAGSRRPHADGRTRPRAECLEPATANPALRTAKSRHSTQSPPIGMRSASCAGSAGRVAVAVIGRAEGWMLEPYRRGLGEDLERHGAPVRLWAGGLMRADGHGLGI